MSACRGWRLRGSPPVRVKACGLLEFGGFRCSRILGRCTNVGVEISTGEPTPLWVPMATPCPDQEYIPMPY